VATTTDGHVTAFAVRDGTRAWDRALGPRQPTAPACDAGRVFTATTDALGVAAKVHALDLATGEPAWTRALSDKVGVTTSLAVAGGGVIVAATTGTVYRLDRDTGSVTWTATARGELRDAPAVAAKVVLVCSAADDGGCTAFDLTTGVRRWEKAVGPASGAPVIAGGSGAGGAGAGGSVAVVPVAKGGGVSLAALRLSTGEALWSVSVPGRGSCTPTLSAGLLLVGNDAGAVYLVGRTAPAGFPAVASGAEGGATGAPSGYALFRGEGTRLGVFRGKVPSAPRVLWSAKAGDDIGYPGQPVVFDGRVFVGSGSGGVYAFDERSGKKLWHFDTRPASGAGGSGGPAGGGGGGDGSDAIGFGVYTSPTYWNGLVLAGSYDRSTYAVDARTGKVRWRFKTGGLLEASVCVESGAAMIASFDGRLYAVDVLSGRELWSYNARGALQTSPACAGGRVYAAGAGDGTPGQAFAVDAATGRELWVHPLDESPVLAVTLAGDALYVAGDGGTLRALAPDDGRELWSAPGPSPMREAVAIADRKLFACSSTGLCGAYRLPGGAKVWEKKIGAASRGAPFWAGGVVVATAVDAPPEAAPGKPAPRGGATEVVGLDATSGTELWRVRLDGTTRTSAALYNGHIYVGTETGALHALGDPPR
jgi:outer membrane protein assembly factor BamB